MANQIMTQLANDIRQIIDDARQALEQSSRTIMIQAYWNVGKRIAQAVLPTGGLAELADQLAMEYTQLIRCVMFYQQWPKACPEADQTDAPLSWGHYRVLMTEKDGARRQELLKQARQHGWNRNQLQGQLKAGAQEETFKPGGTLTPSTSMLFIYGATVKHVVDGDTLELMIDLGFDVFKEQRIRLRGINTPELSTPVGEQAKAFVEARLNQCERIVVKTSRKIDIYGRYIGDIFYLPDVTDRNKILSEGTYLNNELLVEGLAELY